MRLLACIVMGLTVTTTVAAQTISSADFVPVSKNGVRIQRIYDTFNGYTACQNALTPLCNNQNYSDCALGTEYVYLSSEIMVTYRGTECAFGGICYNIYDCRGTCVGVCSTWERPDREDLDGCPILMDLENDGIRLTGTDDPVWFDIDANGTPDLMSWTNRSEGLLALDRNGNGMIDDGSELFGNYTRLSDGTRASNGYLALAELDSNAFGGNGNGQLDSGDAAFGSLQIWTDVSHDGISQPNELQTLDKAGIRQIGLDYNTSHRKDVYGNEFRFLGRAWKIGPNEVLHPILTWDVFFVVAP